jgi:hypothetical protein
MDSGRAFIIALAILVSYGSDALAQNAPAPKSVTPAQKSYSSTQAVFDAYREAVAKNDIRTEFSCWVPEIREVAADYFIGFSLPYANFPEESPKLTAALKKCGADDVMAEYVKQFKAKRGFDPVKAQAEYEAKVKKIEAGTAKYDELGPWPNTLDEELLRKIASERFTDKVGVVIALEDATRDPQRSPTRFGSLRNIRICGNTAFGVATGTNSLHRAEPGQAEKIVSESSEAEFIFRHTKGGWLISTGQRGSTDTLVWPPKATPPPPAPPIPGSNPRPSRLGSKP